MKTRIIYLSLGSNLGDRQANLASAIDFLELKKQKISSIYETEPWGKKDQPWFLNLVVKGRTEMSAQDFLIYVQKIEQMLGRNRQAKKLLYAPRPIDIDIIYYADIVLRMSDLIVPHPLLEKRRFVLEPLNEIAHGFLHPVSGKTSAELLNECQDASIVRKL